MKRALTIFLVILTALAEMSLAAGELRAVPDSLAARDSVAESAAAAQAGRAAAGDSTTVRENEAADTTSTQSAGDAAVLLPFAESLQAAEVSEVRKMKGKDFKRRAREAVDTLSAEFLDTVNVKKSYVINDYSMLGFNYGVTFSSMIFNPSKRGQKMVFTPNYMTLMYTKYCKMFGYIQNFGVTAGLEYGHEGYRFEPDENGRTAHVDSATYCSITMIDVPAMAQFHFDIDPVKIMIDLGMYAGYRSSIERSGTYMNPKYENTFRDYEIRFDYGLKGGVGFAVMLDPIEIHLNAHVRWSWSNLYQPDYYSQYYYRFANPLDIMVSLGVYYQITKRRGTTNRDIKRQAKEMIYGKQEQ